MEVGTASKADVDILRILTPLAKLYTAKQSFNAIADCLECLGGAGYMEDATGLPSALRGQMVLYLYTYLSFFKIHHDSNIAVNNVTLMILQIA